ncbi:MAG: peptidylprolyl isomerase [Pseudorhodobacter sp.]
MRKGRIVACGVFTLGLAALATFLLSPSSILAQETDGPGPNLVIDIEGEATGQVTIDLLPDLAPKHVEQIVALARDGAYDGVVFHRVIDGFMAQTGDVEFGKGDDLSRAGMGGSSRPDLPAEFSGQGFDRGIVGMARSQDPNSANSQFFIMFAPGPFLDGQYTVVGRVVGGMDVVDGIKRGEGANGEVSDPDRMVKVTVAE